MVKRFLYSFLVLICCLSCTHSFDVQNNTPVGNMEALWQIIDEKYCFLDEKNLDWQSLRQPYIDSAACLPADDKFALFDLMARLLSHLHDGHVNLSTSFDVSSDNGWYIGYPVNYNSDIINRNYLIHSRLAGGMYYTILENDSVGYVRYSSFNSAISAANMYYVLTTMKDCKGLILDVRSNGGGDLDNAYKLASTFLKRDTIVGYWQHKSGKGHHDFSALEPIKVSKDLMPSKWYRPVVVLMDRRSYSATNSFCNCMRYVPQATLLGGVSGGGGGMPLGYELPNGWHVRFSSVRMTDADKVSIEPGVCPHVYDTLRYSDRDNLIEHAVQIIHSKYEK